MPWDPTTSKEEQKVLPRIKWAKLDFNWYSMLLLGATLNLAMNYLYISHFSNPFVLSLIAVPIFVVSIPITSLGLTISGTFGTIVGVIGLSVAIALDELLLAVLPGILILRLFVKGDYRSYVVGVATSGALFLVLLILSPTFSYFFPVLH